MPFRLIAFSLLLNTHLATYQAFHLFYSIIYAIVINKSQLISSLIIIIYLPVYMTLSNLSK